MGSGGCAESDSLTRRLKRRSSVAAQCRRVCRGPAKRDRLAQLDQRLGALSRGLSYTGLTTEQEERLIRRVATHPRLDQLELSLTPKEHTHTTEQQHCAETVALGATTASVRA